MSFRSHPSRFSNPQMVLFLFLLCFLSLVPFTSAQIYSPSLSNCLNPSSALSPSYLINLTSAFAQFVPIKEATALGLVQNDGGVGVVRVDLMGVTGEELLGFDNSTGKLATMFTTTTDLTYDVYKTTTYVCNSIFPPSPLPDPYFPFNTTYCPLPAGSLGINLTIPLSSNYPLSTLTTTIRIVDTAIPANELTCAVLSLTPYFPDEWYYDLLLWVGVILAIGFWVSSWAGRFAAGWVVGRMVDGDSSASGEGNQAGQTGGGQQQKENERVVEGWGRSGGQRRKWGTMLISGLSGERLGVSGGLLRFITPGFRDIIWHLQFCAVLAMVAVQWPEFAYPILAQGAWASLIWNATIVQGAGAGYDQFSHTLDSTANDFPTGFGEQFNSTLYPLYMDASLGNRFLDLHGAQPGIASFAGAIGLRPEDMYPTCLVFFLCFGAIIIFLSLLMWFLHGLAVSVRTQKPHTREEVVPPPPVRSSWAGSPASSEFLDLDKRSSSISVAKDGMPLESPTPYMPTVSRNKSTEGLMTARRAAPTSVYKRIWWQFRIRGTIGQYHWNALCGNLLRLLLLGHQPVTLFSVYQWSIRKEASLVTVILSAVSFAVFSILLPIYLIIRIRRMPTGKLYDATRTLLSLGPMYNMYKQGSQYYQALRFAVSLSTGVVVGAGQASGIAQAIILVGIEITFGLVTMIWQPWRPGAGMAVSTVIFSSLRIASGVLLLLMSSAIGFPIGVIEWLAYILLGLQALTISTLLIMLVCKIVEGLIRLFGNVRFEHSTHPLDGGVLSAFGGLAAARTKRRKRSAATTAPSSHRSSTAGSINTQMMLDRHSTNTSNWRPSGDAGQYPPQRPLSAGPNWRAQPGYAPVEMEEILSEQPVVKGFHVNRGQSGKAAYADPYAAIPQASPPRSRESTYQPFAAPSTAPPQLTQHQRARSQTAIVETIPSPTTRYLNLPHSGPPSPIWPVNGHSAGPSEARGRPILPPLAVQRLGAGEDRERGDSPTSAYSDYSGETGDKPARKGWFASKGKRRAENGSDDENEADVGERKSGKGWLASLKGNKSSMAEDDTPAPSDENAARKAALPQDFEPSVGSQAAPMPKSFSVNRAGKQGTSSSPSSSNPATQPPTPTSADSQPRSFRVLRAGQSRAQTPEPNDTLPSPDRRAFVVNRPSVPGPVSFQPLARDN